MTDNLSPEDRLKTMRAVKSKGTKLEMRLFAMLSGMGLKGWRKNAEDVAGKPDVVFDKSQVVIFVDGCFWHGCPHCKRPLPQTNREYWEHKIERTVQRDLMNRDTLVQEGWTVIRIWEHEIRDRAGREQVRPQIRAALEKNNVVGPGE